MPKIVALLLPLLIGLSFTSHAKVYKSTDDDGNACTIRTQTQTRSCCGRDTTTRGYCH
jgi:hypothetical protein